MTRAGLVATILFLLAGGAGAQTAYRCGAGGSEYSPSPCPEGRAVEVADARTPAQREQAADAARREAKLADRLRQERLQREAAVRPAGAVGIRGERGVAAARPASGPAPAKKKSDKKKKSAHAKVAAPQPGPALSVR